MMDDVYFKRVMTSILLIVLIVLSFLLVKPILMSIIIGILLAFIFGPVYALLHKKTKSRNLSAGIVSAALALIIIVPFWIFTPVIISQSFKIYQAALNFDLVTPLEAIFPALFSAEGISTELVSIVQSFTSTTANFLVDSFARISRNFCSSGKGLFLYLTLSPMPEGLFLLMQNTGVITQNKCSKRLKQK